MMFSAQLLATDVARHNVQCAVSSTEKAFLEKH